MTTCVWCGGSTGEPVITECWRCENERPFVERHHVRIRRMLDAMWDEALDGPETLTIINHADRMSRSEVERHRAWNDYWLEDVHRLAVGSKDQKVAGACYDMATIHAFEAGDLP